ncbi:hypothetical protein WR25_19109 isoform A [Diploscapter pachys]|uniref:BTB domain-containing protein n=2 Tax=Diploscapter pachys TaxID=2018661 RepID=A0A2A2L362_9BILA|nr:hypothetical protein WR25_19109 isoform A [Diploscapter pachys]
MELTELDDVTSLQLAECCSSTDNVTAITHKSPIHGMFLTTQLCSIRDNEMLCDVTLVANGAKIQAHRLVLAACSSYFRAMFTNEMIERRKKEIEITDVDPNTLEALVNFCYCGEIRISDANVQNLLPAACLLQLSEVQDVCCDFLKKQLDPSNCLGIRAFADTHACRELLRSADKYALRNFQQVVGTEEFMSLSYDLLKEIISSEELHVQSEEQVYDAIVQWVRHDLEHRRNYFSKLLQHVRLPLCRPKFLVSIGEEILVKSDASSRDLVDEAKNYLLLPLERSKMQGPRTRPRNPLQYGEVLYAVGGWCSGDALASVERFDPLKSPTSWVTVAAMTKRRCGVGVAVLDNLIFACGGHCGQSYLNSVERYDPATNQWSCDVAPTSTCRTSVGVAVLDGRLYACGGQDGVSCLDVVERYDATRNEWCKIAPMKSRRLGVSVCVYNGCIYAVGGSNGESPLNSVERYDPRSGKWELVKPMATRRKHLGAALFEGTILAVGGRDDACELNSVERYHPAKDEWTSVVAMNSRRSGVGLAVVNEKLYAVGGFDGHNYLGTVEIFDSDSNQWRLHRQTMKYRRLGGGVGVIRMPQNDTSTFCNSGIRDTERKIFGADLI